MNFGRIGAATAVTTMVLAGSLLGAEPASAISVGDILNFTTSDLDDSIGPSFIDNSDGTFTLSLGDIVINEDTATSFGTPGTTLSFADLTLKNIGGAQYTLDDSITTPFSWITGGLLDSRTFELETFDVEVLQFGSLFGFQSIGFHGFFDPPGINAHGGVSGFGQISVDESGVVSGSIEVIPTPAAVLPGLMGMATAAFRKKKQKENNELATIEAEA